MKIGKLEFKDYAANKPLSISASGDFLMAKDLLGTPSLRLGSLHTLARDEQLRLAVARYKLEPDFKLGILGIGVLTRDEIITHMEQRTDFGVIAINVEMAYCNELMSMLDGALADWPKVPKPPTDEWPDWKQVKKCFWLKVKTQALFCENTTDGVTGAFAKYRIANVHPAFATRGFSVCALTGHDDTRNNFVPKAKSKLTGFVGGIGHGAYTLYTGDASNHILEVGHYDPTEVAGKAFHFLSCQTGRTLGPDTIAKGAKCYVGYDENFTFIWDDPATPMPEWQLFAKADSTFDLMMANGATAQVAYNATIQAFSAGMAQVPNSTAAAWLKFDRDHLRLHGDPGCIVLPARYIKICFPLAQATEKALALAGELGEE